MVENPFLRDLTPTEYELLSGLFEPVDLAARTVIFRQGTPAVHMYFLQEGTVSLRYKPYDGPRITLTHLHAGDVFGWSAVVGNTTYTSDAITTTASKAQRVGGAALRHLCIEFPETGSQILRKLAVAVAPRWVHSRNQVRALLQQQVLTHT